MLIWRNCVDDDQAPAATRTRKRENAGKLVGVAKTVIIGVTLVTRRRPEQLPDPGNIGCTVAISEEAIVTDAVLAFG